MFSWYHWEKVVMTVFYLSCSFAAVAFGCSLVHVAYHWF